MPYIPHSKSDINTMLETIGVNDINALFSEIPSDLKIDELKNTPHATNEFLLQKELKTRAASDHCDLCFIGAGSYEHYIPSAVWDIVSRGEFMTAYTPYQAEASQGSLQLIYEYQTMMASLTGMDASNASLYDGGSSLAEAILMAIRANRKDKSKKIMMPSTVHPFYQKTAHTIVDRQGIEFIDLPFDNTTGTITMESLSQYDGESFAAIVIPFPNFFGQLEDVDALTKWAKAKNAFVIALCNPTVLALLKSPGQWGDTGADIVCGEGQPLGVPLASGGPYFGYMCCKKDYIRQLPGRIVGKTIDAEGKSGYTLTLQAREQHIRRSKATSNICTNQGLLVTAATIYMSLMGPEGLKLAAAASHTNTKLLVETLCKIKGIKRVFDGPFFHEALICLPKPVAPILEALAEKSIQGGITIESAYPKLSNTLLVCATETKTQEDIERFSKELACII